MKKYMFVTIIALLTITAYGQSKGDKTLVVPGEQTGLIAHHKPVPKSIDGYTMHEKTTKDPDGDPVTYYEVQQDGKRVLEIYYLTDGAGAVGEIYRVGVFSKEFRTAEGLGIGSTLEDLRKIYPEGLMLHFPPESSFLLGKRILVYEPIDHPILFLLDESGCLTKLEDEYLELSSTDFKPGTKVLEFFH